MRRPLRWIVGPVAVLALLAGCGDDGDGDAATTACEPVDATLQVVARDSLQFDAESYETEAGCIEVRYVNDGGIAHTLLVDGVDGFELAVGDTDEGSLSLDAGTYRLYCDLPGHESAGMEAELSVA